MRKIIYEYHNRGMYVTSDDTCFGDDKQVEILVNPHDFSISVSGKVLRSTSCDGYKIIVSNQGKTAFYNNEGDLVGQAEESNKSYEEVRVFFEDNTLSVQFGFVDVIDHYPNCDGEHDRYSHRWTPERKIKLNLNDNSLKQQ